MNFNLKISAFATIVLAVFLILLFVLRFISGYIPSSSSVKLLLLISISSIMAVGFLKILGYIKVAELNKLKYLELSLYFLIATSLTNLIPVFFYGMESLYAILTAVFAIVTGFNIVLVGILLLQLREKFGNIMVAISILYIINGIILANVIFVFLLPITMIILGILEVIFFVRASNVHDKKITATEPDK